MNPLDLIIEWDQEEDTLSAIRPGVLRDQTANYEVSFEVMVRKDDAGQTVGFDIEDFSKVFPSLKDRTEGELRQIFSMSLEFINNRDQLAVARQLIPA